MYTWEACCRLLQQHLRRLGACACRGTPHGGPGGSDAVPADSPANPVCAASMPLHGPRGCGMRREQQPQSLLRAKVSARTVCRRLLRARLRMQASAHTSWLSVDFLQRPSGSSLVMPALDPYHGILHRGTIASPTRTPSQGYWQPGPCLPAGMINDTKASPTVAGLRAQC